MRFIATGLLLLAMATPAWADVQAGAKPQAAPQAPPPKGVWRPDGKGGYEHVQTGLLCPERIGDHLRRQVELFNKFGTDVGCDYPSPASGVTYYLTRRQAGGIGDAMAEAKRELLLANAARHPELASETRSQDAGVEWTVVLYREDGELADAIWMADVAGWTLEYRVTYHAVDQAKVVEELKSVTAAVMGDIGPRLRACATAPPADRPGRAITDKAVIESASMMTSVVGGILQTATNKPGATTPDPTFRCPEQTIERDGIAMLFWRTIRPDGSDAQMDEVSVETNNGPVIMSFSSGMSGLLASIGDKKTDQPPQWSATVQTGERTMIFGYFAGRPSIDDMADLFAGALRGRTKAVGGYSAKGNAITIQTPPK